MHSNRAGFVSSNGLDPSRGILAARRSVVRSDSKHDCYLFAGSATTRQAQRCNAGVQQGPRGALLHMHFTTHPSHPSHPSHLDVLIVQSDDGVGIARVHAWMGFAHQDASHNISPSSHDDAPPQVDGGYGPRAWEVYMKMGELLQTAGDWQQAKEAYDQATAAAPHEVLCSAPSPRSPRMRLLAACWSFLHWLSALLYFCQPEVGSLLVNDTKKITLSLASAAAAS